MPKERVSSLSSYGSPSSSWHSCPTVPSQKTFFPRLCDASFARFFLCLTGPPSPSPLLACPQHSSSLHPLSLRDLTGALKTSRTHRALRSTSPAVSFPGLQTTVFNHLLNTSVEVFRGILDVAHSNQIFQFPSSNPHTPLLPSLPHRKCPLHPLAKYLCARLDSSGPLNHIQLISKSPRLSSQSQREQNHTNPTTVLFTHCHG